jgi:hypothetical protein
VLSSAAGLMEIRAQAERDSGIGLKLFGFIAESVFTFIPESCSRSSRNSVRNHPGIAFTFPRIPHISIGRPSGIGPSSSSNARPCGASWSLPGESAKTIAVRASAATI